jgi:hypothetical protein
VLQSKCPYFTTLFGTRIPTREIAENSVTLDSAVDTVDAWKMCIQFLYLNSYNMVDEEKWTQCVVNAGVYVLAQKLCMEALKEMALEKFADLLQGMYQGSFTPSGKEVARLVEVVYGGTEDHEGGEDVVESAATPVECAEEPRGGDEGGDEGIVGEQERNQETQHSKGLHFTPSYLLSLSSDVKCS